MKKITIAMLSTALIGTAVFAASTNNPQQPTQGAQTQPQNNNQAQRPTQPNTQQNAQRQNQPNNQQAAASPQNMPRSRIIIVQRALDKSGFNAGKADGRWGPKTTDAVKQFQQSKQIQPSGQLDQQTVADLGLDASRFQQQPRQNQR
jgi:peptidoglycan hydrolase-like protein with peptidoglycan-binding domain